MKIEGDIIVFKSYPRFFLLERYGQKPNTVRQIKGKEWELFRPIRHKIKHILIINKDTNEHFTRVLTDISPITFSGIELWIFSWVKKE